MASAHPQRTIHEILDSLPKPSHYLGCEHGSAHKDPAAVTVRLALAFPDLYEVGMSYTGHAILYSLVNAHEQFWAERVFAPTEEAEAVLRDKDVPLSTLESGTPLTELDAVGFSLTHELCYTNVLQMLDLAGIPLRTENRRASDPLILAGGGAAVNAEPLAPFVDALLLGDGEELLIDVLAALEEAKAAGEDRAATLARLATIAGVYVPADYEVVPGQHPGTSHVLLKEGQARPTRRIVRDLNTIAYPTASPEPFKAVHDRYTLEIARGCTRGCRFCHAGVVYRPVRERSVETLERTLIQALETAGHGEVSFLSLSTGDFSALAGLFERTVGRCRAEQISLSLPSLRVGSVSEEVMAAIASIRRTGATIAPEAGSQRLRDVINKGVTEEGLMEHVKKLFLNGWQGVKLYFMIGLPTETQEDLDAILEVCKKVSDLGRWTLPKELRGRLQVTGAVSPFVPKPHTPFQWERQDSYEETREKVAYLREIFRPHRRLKLRWHMPEMSWLEGVFSRGGRGLAPAIERAYEKGALFTSWTDKLRVELWREVFEELGIDADGYLAERDADAPLPWSHIDVGVSERFLKSERARALEGKITEDCRYGACRNCGVCNDKGTELPPPEERVGNLLNRATRDQDIGAQETPPTPAPAKSPDTPDEPATGETPERPDLSVKACHLRVWYQRLGSAAYVSQLEMQTVLEKALRRARLPLTFSSGFHPLPLISFARALPVGVASEGEYFDLFLREALPAEEVLTTLKRTMPAAFAPIRLEELTMTKKQPQAIEEAFRLVFTSPEAEDHRAAFRAFAAASAFPWTRETKKGERTTDIRPYFKAITPNEDGSLSLTLTWQEGYLSPLSLCRAVVPDADADALKLTKTGQTF